MFRTAGLVCSLILGGAQEPPKHPVPDSSAQKATEKEIREIFKEEYARTGASDKTSLARKLVKQADDSKEAPATRFVLLREARDLLVQSGDLAGALTILDTLCSDYDLERVKFRTTSLAAMASAARTPEEHQKIAQAYLVLADEAAAAADWDAAQKAALAAGPLARKSKDLNLVRRADSKGRELAELKNSSDQVQKAEETLARNPEDREANAILGEFRCLVRGDWEKGLPLLLKGAPSDLVTLAGKDGANPTEPPDQAKLGDLWWDLAEKKSGPSRENLRKRAAFWYEKAAGGVTGLTKAKVIKRLQEAAPNSALSMQASGIYSFASAVQSPPIVNSGGEWRVEGGELLGTCPGDGQWATLGVSYASMTEVTVRVRIVPPAKFNFRYWVGDYHFIFNHEIGRRTECRNGKQMTEMFRDLLTPGKEHDITVREEGGKVLLLVDGKKEWETTGRMKGTISFQAAHGSTIGVRQIRVNGTVHPTEPAIAPARPLP